ARIEETKKVEQAILDSNDLRNLSPELLRSYPNLLPTLRMSCCPPLAVDRLVGLAKVSKSLVASMEQNKLGVKMAGPLLTQQLINIVKIVNRLLDPDIFVWIPENR